MNHLKMICKLVFPVNCNCENVRDGMDQWEIVSLFHCGFCTGCCNLFVIRYHLECFAYVVFISKTLFCMVISYIVLLYYDHHIMEDCIHPLTDKSWSSNWHKWQLSSLKVLWIVNMKFKNLVKSSIKVLLQYSISKIDMVVVLDYCYEYD